MNNLYKFLSGNIPGGLFVLIFALLIVNLVAYLLFKKSELFAKPVYKKSSIWLNLVVLFLYFFLWFLLQPRQLPKTVLIQPFQHGDTIDVTISEMVERNLSGNLSAKFRLHPWEWFYLTADKDSINNPAYRRSLTSRLKIDMVVRGQLTGTTENIKVEGAIEYANKQIALNFNGTTWREAAYEIIRLLDLHTNILQNKDYRNSEDTGVDYTRFSRAKMAYLNNDYTLPLQILEGDSLYLYRLIMSRSLLKKALVETSTKPSLPAAAEQELNPFYRRMERLLLPYSVKGTDTAELNSILGQMYLYRQEYETANICLRKAISQNPYDARLFYYLSFLDIERLKELRFRDRVGVLQYAIRLDPGYLECVLRLANDVYNQGSGTSVARTTYEAIEIMENYLKLNSNTVPVLKLLGKIYQQISNIPRATALFEKVIKLEPDTAGNYYDLGICYFKDKRYEPARSYFEQAIKLGDHREAYLYLGAVYYVKNDLEKALYYYRERIKRKINDDDHYALEAMRGVRIILEKMQADSAGKQKQDSIPPSSPFRQDH